MIKQALTKVQERHDKQAQKEILETGYTQADIDMKHTSTNKRQNATVITLSLTL